MGPVGGAIRGFASRALWPGAQEVERRLCPWSILHRCASIESLIFRRRAGRARFGSRVLDPFGSRRSRRGRRTGRLRGRRWRREGWLCRLWLCRCGLGGAALRRCLGRLLGGCLGPARSGCAMLRLGGWRGTGLQCRIGRGGLGTRLCRRWWCVLGWWVW